MSATTPKRRAFICVHKDHQQPNNVAPRVFVGPDDPVPNCAEHGKMTLQPNNTYMGRKVP